MPLTVVNVQFDIIKKRGEGVVEVEYKGWLFYRIIARNNTRNLQ